MGGPNLNDTKSRELLVTWLHDKLKKTYIYTSAIPMAIKLDRVVTYGQKTSHTRSHLTFWSSGLVTNVRPYVCTFAISLATKLDRVVTCDGGTPSSRSCDLLIMWSREKMKKTCIYTYFPVNIRLDKDVLKTSFVFVFRKRLQDVLIKTNMFALALRLQKTSSRRLGQDQCIRLGHTSSRRLQNVFKMSSRHLAKTSSRHLQGVLPRRLQEV